MDTRGRALETAGAEALEEIIRSAIGEQVRQFWTAMPVSLSEDSDGRTAGLKFSVKVPERDENGEIKYVDLPGAPKAPIQFASGGGMTSTLPLKEKDEGLALFASRAVAAWRQSGGVQQAIDGRVQALSDAFYIPGIRPEPRDLKDINTEATETRSDDGKNRVISHPKDGTKVSNNHGAQQLDVNATTGAIEATGKTLTLKAGEVAPGRKPNTPNTIDRDLNEQLKGLSARVAQAEKSVHGLFDVTSKFREIVQGRIPEVAAVAHILNQAPGGLDTMVGAIEGKAMAYLQTQMGQALAMFSNPTLAGVASLLGGGIEGLIQQLTQQIAQLALANPIVAQVEGLQRQVDAVLARGASAIVEAQQLAPIQAEIKALTEANPIVGQVAALRDRLRGLVGQAGAGLNFLEPQKRLAKGQIRSMHFSEN